MLLQLAVIVSSLLIVLIALTDILFVRVLLMVLTMLLFFVSLFLVEVSKNKKRFNSHHVSHIL